jgi:hypothetical protein
MGASSVDETDAGVKVNFRLLFVVLYEKEQKAEVVVEDKIGRKRRVECVWLTKDRERIPDSWLEMVQKELDFQDGEEIAVQKGRKLLMR